MRTESDTAENALVERLLAGDERAFEELADEYFPQLYRFAQARLRADRELVAEIVQAAVCKAVVRLETFRGTSSLTTWLCACCRTEIALHFRRCRRTPHMVALGEEGEGGGPRAEGSEEFPAASRDPEEGLLQREVTALVHEALDRLPPRYGKALEWKYVEGLAVKEIGERLDLSPKATESLLTRARQAFREEYGRRLQAPGSGRHLS